MGSCFDYKCSNPACGYEATVSGGKDMGFCGEVETMVCLDCKELMDVLTAAAPDLKAVERKCDECGGKNLKVFHSGKTRCPKCGGRLKKGDDHILWD
jgi:predicted nucleic acid-binding Zn ribbon protein